MDTDVPLISMSLLDRVMVLIAAVQADHIMAAAAWPLSLARAIRR
jgi:hypothetical protein